MSREIKFRAWDVDGGRWQRGASNLMLDMAGNQFWQFGYDINMLPKDDKWVVEQFTGLLDKNGKEIYEGDIVIHQNLGYNEEVYWNNEECVYVCRGGESESWLYEGYEILGNIHESPELLKENHNG